MTRVDILYYYTGNELFYKHRYKYTDFKCFGQLSHIYYRLNNVFFFSDKLNDYRKVFVFIVLRPIKRYNKLCDGNGFFIHF